MHTIQGITTLDSTIITTLRRHTRTDTWEDTNLIAILITTQEHVDLGIPAHQDISRGRRINMVGIIMGGSMIDWRT